ncbi:hypothetical protein LEN26_012994 [Aphanomyces euteiches]|nr:hypothetical protein AeMF1_013320 [Aphanomyces euteiches]KAH9115431.1 hypothetical protein LEN26_012994 [Aphanomyces euteiches]
MAIYLDYNATTPVAKEVVDALVPCLSENYGNPSSSYDLGRRAKAALDDSRASVGTLLHAPPSSIVFMSGGTETINYVLKGMLTSKPYQRHIVTSVVEHVAVLATCRFLQAVHGFDVTYVLVDSNGRVSVDAVVAAIQPSTCLVTIMHANNEVGTIQPLAAIATAARARHEALSANQQDVYDPVLIHTDASQSVGKVPVHVDELHVDFLTVAGHKLYAPKGVGALYIRPGTRPLQKLMHGASHEQDLRAGTENIPYAVALGRACQLAEHGLAHGLQKQLESLRRRLLDRLESLLPDVDKRVNGAADNSLPNTLSISFRNIVAPNVLQAVQDRVAASAGSACHSHTTTASYVLQAMDIPLDYAYGTFRLSVGKYTTEDEVDSAADVLAGAIKTALASPRET